MHIAAQIGPFHVVKVLSEEGKADLHATDNEGKSLHWYACQNVKMKMNNKFYRSMLYQYMALIILLIQAGANVNHV